MKSIIRTALILSSVFLLDASIAHAQVIDRMTFTTAFPFIAAGKELPAGTYTIASVANSPAVLELTSDRRAMVLMAIDDGGVPAAGLDNRGGSEVTFSKLENGSYALSQLWDDGMQRGVQIVWTALRKAGEPVVTTPASHDVRVPATTERR